MLKVHGDSFVFNKIIGLSLLLSAKSGCKTPQEINPVKRAAFKKA